MTERSSPDGEEREALRRLYNEVSGCWNAFEYELRPVISNTNYACVQHKLDAAKAILDHPAPPQAMPQECRRLIKRIDELLHPEGFDPKEAHRELHELAHEFEKLCTQPQAAPEPMAYYVEHKNYGVELSLDPPSEAAIERGWIGTPLYAHPTPPQAARDEIARIICCDGKCVLEGTQAECLLHDLEHDRFLKKADKIIALSRPK